ncbi:Transcriptional activator of glycolytic enzyme [Phytophthora infestans]|uniref:Transcriptional activator of glycolytic enzyme n=1 Tax=Phytophthora infestans TaxID=4787 RepID=A0A833X172_PHYIN|nr:Transcriptional activator of glycolytic enzyme [Phytophthora infestans]
MLTEKSPQTTHLHEVVPDLMDHLKQQQQQQTIAHIDNKINEISTSINHIATAFSRLTSGSSAVRLTVDWGSAQSSTSTPVAASQHAPLPPTYKLVRSIKTVQQVWQEWTTGIHGGPAVRDLEERYGSNWRNSPAEKRFFFRRKRIIDRVTLVTQQQHVSEAQAVCILEGQRTQSQLTLNALSESLKGWQ